MFSITKLNPASNLCLLVVGATETAIYFRTVFYLVKGISKV